MSWIVQSWKARADAAVSKLIQVCKGSQKSRRDFRKIFQFAGAEDRQAIEGLADQLNLKALFNEVLAQSDKLD